MGQRLTIQVYHNRKSKESLATIYYHWSGFTVSALEELEHLVKTYRKTSKSFNRRGALYAAVLEHGGGIEDWAKDVPERLNDPEKGQKDNSYLLAQYEDFMKTLDLDPEIRELYENVQTSANRNEGIISFTEKGQKGMMRWSEGNIKLYLDEEAFDFDVFISLSPDEFYDDYKDWSHYLDDYDESQSIVEYLEENHTLDIDRNQVYQLEEIPVLIDLFKAIDYFYDPDAKCVVILIA